MCNISDTPLHARPMEIKMPGSLVSGDEFWVQFESGPYDCLGVDAVSTLTRHASHQVADDILGDPVLFFNCNTKLPVVVIKAVIGSLSGV